MMEEQIIFGDYQRLMIHLEQDRVNQWQPSEDELECIKILFADFIPEPESDEPF